MSEPSESEFEREVISRELDKSAELIGNPDVIVRRIGVGRFARAAFTATETSRGGGRISRILRSAIKADGMEVPSGTEYLDEDETRRSKERYESIVNVANDVILALDDGGKVTFINGAIEGIAGYKPEEIVGLTFDHFVHPEDLTELNERYEQSLNGDSKPYEVRIVGKGGEKRWMRASSSILLDRGRTCGVTCILTDITEQKKLEEKLTWLSLVDPLTGLHSRHYLEEQSEILRNGRRYPVGVVNIDVDGLHDVNNNLGHDTGDAILVAVGGILQDSFRQEDCVARAGGDEFLILLPETSEDELSEVVKRIQDRLDKYNTVNPNLPISLSIGSATALDSSGWFKMLKTADELMYDNKSRNGETRKSRRRVIDGFQSGSE